MRGQVPGGCTRYRFCSVLPPAGARELHRLYLIKGVRATTAIEGNTLGEEQIAAQLEGELELPLSQEYLKREVENVLAAVNEIFGGIMGGEPPALTPDWIARANRRLLAAGVGAPPETPPPSAPPRKAGARGRLLPRTRDGLPGR